MFCNKCGNKLEDDMKFCNKCGNKVGEIIVDSNKETSKTDSYNKKKKSNLVPILMAIGIVVVFLVFINKMGNDVAEIGKSQDSFTSAINEKNGESKSYKSDINFKNPSSIENGKVISNKYVTNDLGCIIKNMNVNYIESDNKGRYAFKVESAISSEYSPNGSMPFTFYVILIIEGNNQYSYEGSIDYSSAKLSSNWGQ